MSGSRLRVVVIAGPTGVGKTAVAVALARRTVIEVISADSRQVYRGMDVATGKPTFEERRAVAHHLIDVVNPDDRYQAARFRNDAPRAVEAIHSRGRLPVIVGGTGLYIRALLRGLDPAPPADPVFRQELASIAAREGPAALHARLAAQAPAVAQRLHPNDHVRVMRALEMARAGGAVLEQERWRNLDGPYEVSYFGLSMDRRALARRLEARAAAFVAAGLRDEVQRLLAWGYHPELPALQSSGYHEFVQVVRGTMAADAPVRLLHGGIVPHATRPWHW